MKSIKFSFKLAVDSSKFLLIILFLCSILGLVFPIISMFNTQNIVNLIQIGATFTDKQLLFSILLFPIFSLLTQTFLTIQGHVSARLKDIMDYTISLKTLTIVSNEPLSSFENPEFYDVIQRAEQSGGVYPYSITLETVSLISQVISLLSYIMILVYWKWWTIFIIAIFPLLSSLQIKKVNETEYEIFQKRTNLERKGWYFANLLNKDENIKETKLFGLELKFLNSFIKLRLQFLEENASLLKRRNYYSLFINFISIISTSLVLIMVFYETSIGIILIGSLMTYINSIGNVKSSFNSIVELIFKIHQDSLYLKHVEKVLLLEKNEPTEENIEKVKIDKISTIEFKNVSFVYPRTNKFVLKDISLKLESGNNYSLIGLNGSGKTTLIKILMGFYNEKYSGEILINGYDLNTLDITTYKKNLSVVFQDFTKYQFSVNEVISVTEENGGSLEKILSASKKAASHEFITQLPNGYHQQLGNWFPQGIQLSGGEWQKMAIAKSFYRDSATLFIFDEPSSALDPIAEASLYTKFNQLTKEKIGIFITHRINNVQFNGKIIVLDNGEIKELGNYEELMLKKGYFYKLRTTSNVIE